MSRIKFKVFCQSCGQVWLAPSLGVSCPRCHQKNFRYLPAKIGGYRLGCQKCNVFWYDEVAPAPCIKCGDESSNILPLYTGEGESLDLPFREPIDLPSSVPSPSQVVPKISSSPSVENKEKSPRISPSSSSIPPFSPSIKSPQSNFPPENRQLIFRLGCRHCNVFWYYMRRESPCPKCGKKSTSSKDEYILQSRFGAITFNYPYSIDELPNLHSYESILCPSCGLQMGKDDHPNFCPSCGMKLVEGVPDPWRSIFCLQCGTEIQMGATEFCPVCGNPVKL